MVQGLINQGRWVGLGLYRVLIPSSSGGGEGGQASSIYLNKRYAQELFKQRRKEAASSLFSLKLANTCTVPVLYRYGLPDVSRSR